MFQNLPNALKKSMLIVSHCSVTKELVKLVLYLWLEFKYIVKVKPIISHFEVEVTSSKDIKIKKLTKIKRICDLRRIIEKIIKDNCITGKEIDKEEEDNG